MRTIENAEPVRKCSFFQRLLQGNHFAVVEIGIANCGEDRESSIRLKAASHAENPRRSRGRRRRIYRVAQAARQRARRRRNPAK